MPMALRHIYIHPLTSMTDEVARAQTKRPKPLIHALFFVLGFSIIFVALGTAVSGIGQLVFYLRDSLARIGGAIVIVLGLATMGLFDTLSTWFGRLENSATEGMGSGGVRLSGG